MTISVEKDNENNINKNYVFSTTEKKDKIILYQIENGRFLHLWEYRFDLNKNIDFIDCKVGDINGNGKQEVIVVIYSQEIKNQIYIFKILRVSSGRSVAVVASRVMFLPQLKITNIGSVAPIYRFLFLRVVVGWSLSSRRVVLLAK